MGPFVPDIITDELNLIVALVLGIGFGFVLEQAGFSSSRRLVGLFYGYDFTVLRVFFTAAVTAMAGVLLLGSAGLLDTDMIYVNPTWLVPAIAGGIVMGIGFVVGGYCPGTSVCAASIGKIDALWFIGGGLLGVFIFGELYPVEEGFYNSTSLGPIAVYESLGMSRGLFAFILIGIAVAAFAGTTIIERKVNPDGPARAFPRSLHRLAAFGVLVLGAILLVLPGRKEHLMTMISDPVFIQNHPVQQIPPDELAFRLVDRDPAIQIIDIRTDSVAYALPGSITIPTRELFSKAWTQVLSRRHRKTVIVGDSVAAEREACLLARELGYENVMVLQGGIPGFQRTIYGPGNAGEAAVVEFRKDVRARLDAMIEEGKTSGKPKITVRKKVVGGC
jgi:uncharacterized protein